MQFYPDMYKKYTVLPHICNCAYGLLTNSFALQDFDPMAEHRVPKIVDRENQYKKHRLDMIISPDRYDPFADGIELSPAHYILIVG